MIINFLCVLCSFLVCGIPFGYLIFKIVKHDDIRKFGSHNIGAANVGRLLGKKYAIMTFLLDGFKGFVSIMICKYIFNLSEFYLYLTFLFCIIGHIFSPYLKFKGGKGVATAITTMFAVNWQIALVMSIVWVICFKVTKISALSALFAIFMMVLSGFVITDLENSIILLIAGIIVFFAHRENIKRLINKNELDFKK